MKLFKICFVAPLFLLGLSAVAQVSVNKSFAPISVVTAQPSTLTITLLNATSGVATAVALTDNLPSGLVVANPATITTSAACGTTSTPISVVAASGSSSIVISSGRIPAASGSTPGKCLINVNVVAASAGSYTNTIPANAVSSSKGTNAAPASATLTVSAPSNFSGSKAFSPTLLRGDGMTTLTITLNNPNPIPLTSAAFTDTLPAGLVVASPATASTTCGSGVVTATSGATSLSLSGGTLPASTSCTVTVTIATALPNTPLNATRTNTIPALAVTTAQGAKNSAAFSANVTVQTGAKISKAFAPAGITPGATSKLTLTLSNYKATAISGINFVDVMPANVSVTSFVSNTCNGTVTFTATQVQLSSGSIAAASLTASGAKTCKIVVNVSSSTLGTHINTIPAGDLNGVSYVAASANLVVSSVTASKSFSPNTTVQSTQVLLTITLSNPNPTIATITAFSDNLTTMGTGLSIAASPAAATTCGGTVSAPAGGTLISKTNGTIPANGTCTITVPVAVAGNLTIGATNTSSNRTNKILVGALQTSNGNNAGDITGQLSVRRAANVSKSFFPSSVGIGGVTRLTITIDHASGASAFTGMSISDTLPSGYTVSSPANLSNSCGGTVTATSGSSTISLSGGTLATGATSCQIAVNVRAPLTAGIATNTIPANTLLTAQGVSYNKDASATITTTASFVNLNKSFSPNNIAVGGISSLTILIENTNPSAVALTGVSLTDVFPTGLVIASVPNASFTGIGCTSGTLSATAGATQLSLAGSSIAVAATCVITVDVTASFTGSLTNQLLPNTVTSDQSVSNTNSPSATLVLLGNADVAVTKTDTVTSVLAGGTTTYTIVVTNNGPDSVAGVSVVDAAPPNTTLTSWSCLPSSGSSCLGLGGVGDIATTVSLLNGGSATFTVNAAISLSASGSLANTVTVTAPASVVDNVPANDQATDTNTVIQQPDLTLSKTVDKAGPQLSDTLYYTIAVTNNGSGLATSVTATDTLPAGLLFLETSGCSSDPNGVLGCALGSIAVGTTKTYTIKAQVLDTGAVGDDDDLGNVLNNTASVTSTETDLNTSNNTGSVNVTISGLKLVKQVRNVSESGTFGTTTSAKPGDVLEYKISYTRFGTAAFVVVLNDSVPSGTEFVLDSYTDGVNQREVYLLCPDGAEVYLETGALTLLNIDLIAMCDLTLATPSSGGSAEALLDGDSGYFLFQTEIP
jgi:uncharacterized repeat protein (TIGR01451 family)